MEKIYSEEKNLCRLAKARPETIRFLLDYSRSLKILAYQGFKFEANIN
ncbi:hypothetical protein [Zeaxanthinibacter enoshimensis]|uniref:Uncharacterized protein n=1 Tax=Zeaxanthinibacter enoshimensis TaxID=392009 RepID=A0A4R6TLW0_9FLAO|nr:hypothetical protein [Zeaxanthinibacter enoshimensis]TDQ31522.1 hypothetical protein CLV82_2230 [Zeaxanthinibacter enoshimensis]